MRRSSIFILGFVFLMVLAAWLVAEKSSWFLVKDASAPSSEPESGVAAPTAIPFAAETPATPRSGVNAADLYKQAYVLFETLSNTNRRLLSTPREEIDADRAAALFTRIGPIMDLLIKAKDAAYCDWALGAPTITSKWPHVQLVSALGQVAFWHAGYIFPSDPSQAVADLAARGLVGRSVGDSLLGLLLQSSFSSTALDLIRQNAPMLTEDALDQTFDFLDSFVPAEDLTRAINTEIAISRSLSGSFLNPKVRDQVLRRTGADAAAIKTWAAVPAVQLTEQMTWLQQTEADFAKKALLPDGEFDIWWKNIADEARSRPLAQIALSVLTNVREHLKLDAVQRNMLAAGLSVMEDGTDELDSYPDPTTGEPFTYITTAEGFELHSPFRVKNKAVTMSFRTAAAP